MESIKLELIRLISELVDEKAMASRSEQEEDVLVERIRALSPDPKWSDYIFWSDEYCRPDGSFDVDGLVTKVMGYRPIIL